MPSYLTHITCLDDTPVSSFSTRVASSIESRAAIVGLVESVYYIKRLRSAIMLCSARLDYVNL